MLDALDAVGDLLRVAAELLTQGQGRGVLGVGAADLDDVGPGLGLGVQGGVQVLQRRQQVVDHLLGAGDVHGRRIGVVRRLAHVDVVVGVDRLLGAHLAAQHLDGAVRDDFVGVHVRLGARTRLPDHQREVVVQLAFDHFIGGGDDGVGQLGVQLAQVAVGLGGGAFDDAQGPDDGQRHLFPADLEVAERALRLSAPVAVGGDLDGAEGVGFDADVAHHRLVLRRGGKMPGGVARGHDGARRPDHWLREQGARGRLDRQRKGARTRGRRRGRDHHRRPDHPGQILQAAGL
ncbi:hypothetical protein D3C81_1349450 [compost metagenome]